jgi:hypothetical protein
MKNGTDDPRQHRLTPETIAIINAAHRPVFEPDKIRRKKRKFVQVPGEWIERLQGAPGRTYELALHLLWLNWRYNGGEIRLSNKSLNGRVHRRTKSRALMDLERRGLISVSHRERRAPTIRLNLSHL